MWLLSSKVSEDIFRKQLERIVGAVATHLQQQQQGGILKAGWANWYQFAQHKAFSGSRLPLTQKVFRESGSVSKGFRVVPNCRLGQAHCFE